MWVIIRYSKCIVKASDALIGNNLHEFMQ